MKEALLRKRPRKVQLDGDTFYVRSMTIAESMKAAEIAKAGEESWIPMIFYVISRCTVDDKGQSIFTDENDESLHEIPTDVAHRLAEEIQKATRPPGKEAILKN